MTRGEIRTVRELFVGAIVGGRYSFQLTQIIVGHCLNRALRLACGRRRLRARGHPKIEVVLDVGIETTGIGESCGISEGVAADTVRERISISDAAQVAFRIPGRDG